MIVSTTAIMVFIGFNPNGSESPSLGSGVLYVIAQLLASRIPSRHEIVH